jgi:predicted transcriptional regulator
MNRSDLKRQNMMLILKAISDKDKSIYDLMSETGISYQNINRILKQLLSAKIIEKHAPVRQQTGRRVIYYKFTNKINCTYIEERQNSFYLISINVFGEVVNRLDYKIRRNISLEENIHDFLRISSHKYSYNALCVDTLVYCTDESAKLFPDNFKRIDKVNAILEIMSEEDKVVLFNIENKIYVYAYGKPLALQENSNIEDIKRVIHIDLEYEFPKATMGVIVAVERHALKNIISLTKSY